MTQLYTSGFCVVPVLTADEMVGMERRFAAVMREFPEFKADARAHTDSVYVCGGFSALGNPASFHNPFVRQLRKQAHKVVVESKVFAPFLDETPGYKLHQVIDRMMCRPPEKAPTAEAWHRDVANDFSTEQLASLGGDAVFGGWINLNERQTQRFSCFPGTHHHFITSPIDPKEKGFGPLPTDEAADCTAMKKDGSGFHAYVEIPPGHMMIFNELTVHEVTSQKCAVPIIRLFTGWRLTTLDTPLSPSDDLNRRLTENAVMPIKSGQMPPMYPKLYWVNWKDKLNDWTDANLIDACKTKREYKSKDDPAVTKRCWVPRPAGSETDRSMPSLSAMGLALYESYADEERHMLVPRTEWTIDGARYTLKKRERDGPAGGDPDVKRSSACRLNVLLT